MSDLQVFYVVRDLAIEEFLPVSAQETEAGAKAQIEDSGGIAQRRVFLQRLPIMLDDLHGVQLSESRLESVMKFMQ